MSLGPAGKAASTVMVATGLRMLCPCLAFPILENLPVFDFFQNEALCGITAPVQKCQIRLVLESAFSECHIGTQLVAHRAPGF